MSGVQSAGRTAIMDGVLRRLSSHQNVKLRDIAAHVIDEFKRTGTLA